jgi:nucleoside-diphosphate-sugar epimerase
MSADSRRVLVTGGAGFVGSFLVDRLLADGYEVVVADDLSRGSFENIEHAVDDIDLVPVDLTTQEGCLRATEDVDDVYHLAASVGGIHYIQREQVGGLTPSVLMNQQMLEAARINDVDRFLFASSACIYRQQHDDLNRFTEDQAIPADPHSTYGWAKVLGEVACQAYHEDCDLDCAMVRIFNAYGPRENLDLESAHVIPSFIRKAIEYPEREFEMFGDGSQERGFIYVTDLVEGMIRAIEQKADGEAINLGNGEEVVSIKELAGLVTEISGKDIEIQHDMDAPEGTYKYAADTTKMEAALDWTPEVSLTEGLAETYAWAAEELGADEELSVAKADGGDDR